MTGAFPLPDPRRNPGKRQVVLYLLLPLLMYMHLIRQGPTGDEESAPRHPAVGRW